MDLLSSLEHSLHSAGRYTRVLPLPVQQQVFFMLYIQRSWIYSVASAALWSFSLNTSFVDVAQMSDTCLVYVPLIKWADDVWLMLPWVQTPV